MLLTHKTKEKLFNLKNIILLSLVILSVTMQWWLMGNMHVNVVRCNHVMRKLRYTAASLGAKSDKTDKRIS